MGEILEKYVDPILDKVEKMANANPEDLLGMLGLGAGGGFIAGIGEDLMTGMFNAITPEKVAGAVKNAGKGFCLKV
jgi:hypothetical protein